LVSSRPAFTCSPSTQTSTTSQSSSRRCFHTAYSSCQWAFRRVREAGDRGAASPTRPRRARSKSPHASPCRSRVGRGSPTSRVRRLNSARTQLTKRLLSPRTRGRRTVMVPAVKLRRRGLPYPLRTPAEASTAPRRAAFGRPNNAVTSSFSRVWINHWIGSRTNTSRRPHRSLDGPTCGVIFCAMAVSPFLAGSLSGGFGHPGGYTAFSLFPHFLVVPRRKLRQP
jgi:hypothetical protein